MRIGGNLHSKTRNVLNLWISDTPNSQKIKKTLITCWGLGVKTTRRSKPIKRSCKDRFRNLKELKSKVIKVREGRFLMMSHWSHKWPIFLDLKVKRNNIVGSWLIDFRRKWKAWENVRVDNQKVGWLKEHSKIMKINKKIGTLQKIKLPERNMNFQSKHFHVSSNKTHVQPIYQRLRKNKSLTEYLKRQVPENPTCKDTKD